MRWGVGLDGGGAKRARGDRADSAFSRPVSLVTL